MMNISHKIYHFYYFCAIIVEYLRLGDYMKEIVIHTEYITLGQFLKYVNAVDSGAVAKMIIQDGQVLVNGEVEVRRGKKLRDNDQISFDGINYMIKNED